MPNTDIYIDGCCLGNPGPGGWAFYIPSRSHFLSGHHLNTTNNRMETTALLEALLHVDLLNLGPITIWSDSKWVINCANRLWAAKENLDLLEPIWLTLYVLRQNSEVLLNWIRGHSNPQHNHTDALAKRAAARAKQLVGPHSSSSLQSTQGPST